MIGLCLWTCRDIARLFYSGSSSDSDVNQSERGLRMDTDDDDEVFESENVKGEIF